MRGYHVLVENYQPGYETRMTELESGSEVKGADREVHIAMEVPSRWSCLALWVALTPLVKWQFWSTNWWLGILAAMIVVMGVVSITLAAAVRENKSLTRKLHQMNVELECTVDSRTMELRKTNEALQVSQKKAEMASHAKSDFLANMSHEIRTPIHGILGLTALLLESELSGDQEESLVSVKECADLLLHIINSVLDLAKIEAGRLDVERVPFDIRKMVSSTFRMMEARAQERGLKLLWEVDEGVPLSLVGDVGKLQQCLLNLVGNALKFTHEGSISVHIRVASDSLQASMMNAREYGTGPESMLIHFEVRDTGIGINKEKLKDMFKPFTQADASTSRLYGGTGLGLCIVHRFVEILDGSIWVESEEEQGSAFHFCLPLSLSTSPICNAGSAQASPRMMSPENVSNKQENHMDGKLAFNNIGAIEQSYSGSQSETSTNVSRAQSSSDLQEMCNGIVISINDHSAHELRDKERSYSLPLHNGNIKPYVHRPAQHFSVEGDSSRLRARRASGSDYETYQESQREHGYSFDTAPFNLHDSSEPSANFSEEMEKALLENKLQLKILLAEDNLVNQKIASRQLRKHGHVVTTVCDGQQALDLIHAQHDSFDLLLMDVQMPIMDGLFATEQIRKVEAEKGWSRVPILGLTAHAIQGYQETCLGHGMDGYLGKPFDVEQLLKTMGHLLPREKLGDQ